MLGRRFFEGEVEGDKVEAAAIRVGRRHKVKTPINRQRRPDTWSKVMDKLKVSSTDKENLEWQ